MSLESLSKTLKTIIALSTCLVCCVTHVKETSTRYAKRGGYLLSVSGKTKNLVCNSFVIAWKVIIIFKEEKKWIVISLPELRTLLPQWDITHIYDYKLHKSRSCTSKTRSIKLTVLLYMFEKLSTNKNKIKIITLTIVFVYV